MLEMTRKVGIIRYRTRIGSVGPDGILISQTIIQGRTGPVRVQRVTLTVEELESALNTLEVDHDETTTPGPYSDT